MKRKFRESNGGVKRGASLPAFTWLSIKAAFMKTFLPLGYPHSVKPEYAEFQMWDSLQALSSYLRGVLSSRFVFEGLGVGDDAKTGLSAALAWVYKDGIGIVSSLLFAYRFTPYFDAYPSSFRLVADTLCNLGLLLNMSLGLLPPRSFILITSLASICFGCLGIASGATKSKISAHLAKGGHLGDIMAKESTQESAITLIGMLLGVAVTSAIGDSIALSWTMFTACTIFHQYANYRLVKILKFSSLNNQRLWLLASEVIHKANAIPSPSQIASMESLFTFPMWLALRGPVIGASIEHAYYASFSTSSGSWEWDSTYLDLFLKKDGSCPYIVTKEIGSRSQRILICLSSACEDRDVVEACLVAYSLCEQRAQFLGTKTGTRDEEHEHEEEHHLLIRRLILRARTLVEELVAGTNGWELANPCLVGDCGFRYFSSDLSEHSKED